MRATQSKACSRKRVLSGDFCIDRVLAIPSPSVHHVICVEWFPRANFGLGKMANKRTQHPTWHFDGLRGPLAHICRRTCRRATSSAASGRSPCSLVFAGAGADTDERFALLGIFLGIGMLSSAKDLGDGPPFFLISARGCSSADRGAGLLRNFPRRAGASYMATENLGSWRAVRARPRPTRATCLPVPGSAV